VQLIYHDRLIDCKEPELWIRHLFLSKWMLILRIPGDCRTTERHRDGGKHESGRRQLLHLRWQAHGADLRPESPHHHCDRWVREAFMNRIHCIESPFSEGHCSEELIRRAMGEDFVLSSSILVPSRERSSPLIVKRQIFYVRSLCSNAAAPYTLSLSTKQIVM